ncbi:MAG: hypothetical protein C0473_02905, partial [Cyanobacteria bacterium DS3.002]|nr:hypothetical protein [Cyanobacteria bacterium DS3.002]
MRAEGLSGVVESQQSFHSGQSVDLEHSGGAHGVSPLKRLWDMLIEDKRDLFVLFTYTLITGFIS